MYGVGTERFSFIRVFFHSWHSYGVTGFNARQGRERKREGRVFLQLFAQLASVPLIFHHGSLFFFISACLLSLSLFFPHMSPVAHVLTFSLLPFLLSSSPFLLSRGVPQPPVASLLVLLFLLHSCSSDGQDCLKRRPTDLPHQHKSLARSFFLLFSFLLSLSRRLLPEGVIPALSRLLLSSSFQCLFFPSFFSSRWSLFLKSREICEAGGA